MKPGFLLAVAALILIAAAVAAALKRGGGRVSVPTKARPLMTRREQAMYWRLKQTFPAAVILAQVAFSALITSPFKHRNRYDRKIADFVLCDASMRVQVVIELDDASHKGREAQDSSRDELLITAGYKVLRFPNVPDAEELKTLVAPLLSGQTAVSPDTGKPLVAV